MAPSIRLNLAVDLRSRAARLRQRSPGWAQKESNVVSINKHGFFSGAGIGALAAAALVAGGAWTGAHAQAGAVNSPTLQAPVVGAPPSFADIVQRVAPAVVSIDVEGKASPSPVAFGRGQAPSPFAAPGGNDGADDGDDNDDDNGAQAPFDFRKLFPQQQQPDAPAPKLQATGSGFFISADGYIVTNNHVVEGADKITVRTTDERSLPAKVIGRDAATDLAVIKVEGSGFAYVSFEDRGTPRVGDWVIAVGNPYDLGGTATAGIVSALKRPNVGGSGYVDYMQIDAPINRGNSGGPTFDMQGRVVGVNTAIFSPSGGSVGIGFDIPADVAAQVTRQLISDGKVSRGYIGARIQEVTPEIADSLGLKTKQGALIADLTPGGPSAQAGLQAGDLVLKVNGHDIQTPSDLTRQVGLARAGDTIHMQIRRAGEERQIDVRSGLRPDEAVLARNELSPGPEGGAPTPPAAPRVLGMRLVPNAEGGLTIQGVSGASDAGQKGLHKGDVIVGASGHKTDSPADLAAAAAQARKDGHTSVLLLVTRDGRHIFVPIKLDDPKPEANG